jgi:putative ABC transport system permease protein
LVDLVNNPPETDTRPRRRQPASPLLQPGMTWLLAWRNLAHDRVRFVVTLIGVAFSVMLMAVQWGLLVGSAETASGLIDHANADFWVMSRGTADVDQSVYLPDRWLYKARGLAGVASVDRMITHFVDWQRPDGGSEIVILVGFDRDGVAGKPWNIAQGTLADFDEPDAIMVDRLYAEKLGVTRVGQEVEIHGHRARIVGFTDGIRAFTQSPYVFTSIDNARHFGDIGSDRTSYLLVRAKPGADRGAVLRQLQAALPMADVLTSHRFSTMTARYWLLTTGAGLALVVGAALGIIVGIIIVAQTLYASTLERLSEYATLRAMGAPNRYLNSIVVKQALISGAIGYAIGITVSAAAASGTSATSIPMTLGWGLAALVGLVTVAMCSGASLVAIHKLMRIEPTTVFR